VALGDRRYVTEVRPQSATVVVGDRRSLEVDGIELTGTTWVGRPPASGATLDVQYRAHGETAKATWLDGRLGFFVPQLAVSPGQTAALYQGDEVLGGGIISRVDKSVRAG
jgi:tRNA-specific 2-thiouridylase